MSSSVAPRRSARLAAKASAVTITSPPRRSERLKVKNALNFYREKAKTVEYIRGILFTFVDTLEKTTCRVKRATLCAEFFTILVTNLNKNKDFAKHFYSFGNRFRETCKEKCLAFITEITNDPTPDMAINAEVIKSSSMLLTHLCSMKHCDTYHGHH
jgi:hypothetical protein